MSTLTTYKTLSSGNIQIVTPEPLAGPAGAALNGNARNFTDAILALAPAALGDIIYGGALGAATILPGNTAAARQFLSQTGTGSASAAPAWTALSAGDITGGGTLNMAGGTIDNVATVSGTTFLATSLGVATTSPQTTAEVSGSLMVSLNSAPTLYNLTISPYVQGAAEVGYQFSVKSDASPVIALTLGYNGAVYGPHNTLDDGAGNLSATTVAVVSTSAATGITLDGTTDPAIVMKGNGTLVGYIAAATNNTAFFAEALTGDICLRNDASGRFLLGQNGALALAVGATVNAYGLFFPLQAASAPPYALGAVYFDTTLNKLRIGGASGWETVTSA